MKKKYCKKSILTRTKEKIKKIYDKEVFTMDNQFDDIDNIIFDYFKTNQEIPPTIEYGT